MLSSPADPSVESRDGQSSGPADHPSFPVLAVLLRPPHAALSLWAPRPNHVQRLPSQLGGKARDIRVTSEQRYSEAQSCCLALSEPALVVLVAPGGRGCHRSGQARAPPNRTLF